MFEREFVVKMTVGDPERSIACEPVPAEGVGYVDDADEVAGPIGAGEELFEVSDVHLTRR